MTGIYVAVDLAALGEAASHFAAAGANAGAAHEVASFDHPETDAAAAEFSRAAHAHADALHDVSARAASVLHGYALGFHQVGD